VRTPISSLPFVIMDPGSFYLTSDTSYDAADIEVVTNRPVSFTQLI
jgi:hypothetical protein